MPESTPGFSPLNSWHIPVLRYFCPGFNPSRLRTGVPWPPELPFYVRCLTAMPESSLKFPVNRRAGMKAGCRSRAWFADESSLLDIFLVGRQKLIQTFFIRIINAVFHVIILYYVLLSLFKYFRIYSNRDDSVDQTFNFILFVHTQRCLCPNKFASNGRRSHFLWIERNTLCPNYIFQLYRNTWELESLLHHVPTLQILTHQQHSYMKQLLIQETTK